MSQRINVLTGTLVLAIPNKEGMVVCADDRIEDFHGRLIDGTNKLHQVGSRAVLTGSGSPIFIDNKTTGELYNSLTEAVEFFSARGAENVGQHLDALRLHIETGFNNFLKGRKKEDWPESGGGPNNHLFRLLIFYLDGKNNFQGYAVKIYFNKEATPPVKVVADNMTREAFAGAAIFGDPKITSEIVNGTNQEYNEFRVITGHLLANQNSPDQVSLKEAEMFGRGFVRAYSEVAPTRFNERRYGANAFCALLSYKAGFQWLPHRPRGRRG